MQWRLKSLSPPLSGGGCVFILISVPAGIQELPHNMRTSSTVQQSPECTLAPSATRKSGFHEAQRPSLPLLALALSMSCVTQRRGCEEAAESAGAQWCLLGACQAEN